MKKIKSGKLQLSGNTLRIGRKEFPLRKFPGMLVDYFREDGDFVKLHFSLEKQGDRWRERGFGSDNVKKFLIYDVSRDWGGGHRLLWRLEDPWNTTTRIKQASCEAIQLVNDDEQGAAVKVVRDSVYGLGLSFASKQLRMISSGNCVAFDSRLQKNLAYKATPAGYQEFCRDCVQVAEALNTRGNYKYPRAELKGMCRGYKIDARNKWRAADVEAAIYHALRPSQ